MGAEVELIPERLLHFQLWDWLRVHELFSRPRYAHHDRRSVDAVLELANRFSVDKLAAYSRDMDTYPPTLDAHGDIRLHPRSREAVKGLAESGFFATLFDEVHGGLQLPNVVHAAILATCMSGCVGTALHLLLTVGSARLIVEKGSRAQITAFAEPQIAGTMLGTMCLSEPHAGSDLGTITTRALADGQDDLGARYRIHGSKTWISAGDHDVTDNIVHLVLAKIADKEGRIEPGTRGISLFIVPKILPDGTRNDVTVTGLNHKMGMRALPNCVMSFGGGRAKPDGFEGAVGWLLGETGQGLPQMFQMMNDARIAVGVSGAALALRGYQVALAYARERVQGTLDGKPVAIIAHPDVKRMLLAQKSFAEGSLALTLFGARLLDEELTASEEKSRREAGALLSLLTPIIKSWPAEFGQESLHHAMQVLGGAGYTTDHLVEKLYRDNRINPIHEGTTGIQAIDLIARKIKRDGGAAFILLLGRINATIDRASDQVELTDSARKIASASSRLRAAVTALLEEDQQIRILAAATPLLNAFGHVVIAWLWLDQSLATPVTSGATTVADHRDQASRVHALRYFVEHELPRIDQWLHVIGSELDTTASMPADLF